MIGRRLWYLVLSCLLLCAGAAQAELLELRQATASIKLQGQVTQSEVSLPYHWDRRHPGQAGSAAFEIDFAGPSDAAESYALYLPKLGNAYEVWLNGSLLDRNGDLKRGNGGDFSKSPQLIAVAKDLLLTQNRLVIRIRADIGRRGGLAVPIFGPDHEVRPLYRGHYNWRVTASLVVMVLSLMVGIVALALWFTQTDPTRPYRAVRDPMYLLGGLAELCWALGVSDSLIEHPPLLWPWWGMVMAMTIGGWATCMGSFCIRVADWSELQPARWFNRLNWTLLALGLPLAGWALAFSAPRALTAWYGGYALIYSCFISYFCWRALRQATPAHRVVALALFVNLLVGLRDWLVFRFGDSYANNTMLRYSSVLFGLAMAYIVITRFREVSAQARDLLANLSSRISQKERELGQTYLKVEQLAREQERVSERTRILRDMHDGVGAHLSTAIRQLQSGKASTDDVLQTLRVTLDQLKLSIDAMHLLPGDIASLLANLRYRLEPRFAASDIELQWVVGTLAPLAHVDANAMRQLQFMIFEALSNVLQHSHATTLAIEAEMAGTGVCLRIVDNGRGFDASLPPRKGLLSLRERAAAIGVVVTISSQPGRTVVELRIA